MILYSLLLFQSASTILFSFFPLFRHNTISPSRIIFSPFNHCKPISFLMNFESPTNHHPFLSPMTHHTTPPHLLHNRLSTASTITSTLFRSLLTSHQQYASLSSLLTPPHFTPSAYQPPVSPFDQNSQSHLCNTESVESPSDRVQQLRVTTESRCPFLCFKLIEPLNKNIYFITFNQRRSQIK